MWSKPWKRALAWGGVLILIGGLLLVNRLVELSPWIWAASLASAGLAAFVLYLVDRSDGLMLLPSYVLWVIAGLITFVVSDFLHDEAVAFYVLLAIALPFLAIFFRDRTRRWALIPAYALLVVLGIIGLAESKLVSDDLISAYVLLATAAPFFVVYAWDRRKRWALIPGSILAVVGLSFGTWLPWHSIRSSLIGGGAMTYFAALLLLIAGGGILVHALRGWAPSPNAAGSGSRETTSSGLGTSEPPAA